VNGNNDLSKVIDSEYFVVSAACVHSVVPLRNVPYRESVRIHWVSCTCTSRNGSNCSSLDPLLIQWCV